MLLAPVNAAVLAPIPVGAHYNMCALLQSV